MFVPFKTRVGTRAVALALALATSSFSAHAILARTGPVSVAPDVGGYPSWYQDTTGLALEFCGPQNAAEVAGGWCLLLPPVVAPEVFPTTFFDEHFYFAAGAQIGTRQAGGKAILVMALEGAFAGTGVPVAGQQIAFARIRVVLNPVPVTGTYRFIHPYGEEVIQGVAGGKIFFTNDIGNICGLNFDCALTGRMGPFLLPSALPGGIEMPALSATNLTPDTDPAHFGGIFAPTAYPGTGKAYIADPARIGPVTGSPLANFVDSTGVSRNHNMFRIEGPAGSGLGTSATGALVDWIETTDFNLMGRVFQGVVPGKFTVDRASYARSGPTTQKLDVFATAVPAAPSRIPTGPTLAVVPQTLTFFSAPCAGTLDPITGAILPPFGAPQGAVETPMKADGTMQWAQTLPTVIPSAVCVKDASARNAAGVVVPQFINKVVTDEVGVTPAFFNPSVGTLTVGATSSDTAPPPILTLTYGTFLGDLVAGQIVVPAMLAPPANVLVESSALGVTRYQVSTGFAAAPVATLPVAVNDSFTFPMNSAAQLLNVLANDTNAVGGTVKIVSPPAFGTAVVNLNGTVSFTPNLNATGTDAFTYTVTVGTQVSNTGIATLNITSVNLPPTAVNDTVNALVAKPRAINVIANDTDPNGVADIVSATSVTQPTPLGATTSVAGGVVTFNATKAGTYTFTYKAVDAGGLISANAATVTVNVAASESISFAKAIYTVAQSRLVATGTVSPVMNQTVKLDYVNSAGTVVGTAGTVQSDGLGNWALDLVGVALPAGAITIKATTSNGTVRTQALQLK